MERINSPGRPPVEREKMTNLSDALRVRGLSRTQAAKKLGVDRQTLSNWIEYGVPKHSVDKVKQLIRRVRVTSWNV